MKIHLLVGSRTACGDMPLHAPLIRDPARVTCGNCRKTKIFHSVLEARKTVQKIKNKFLQEELFKNAE